VNTVSKPFSHVADRILGTQFLADISEFFILFQSMYDGFVERAGAVSRLLSDRRTTFLVVSTLEATPMREAEFFAQELVARKLHLGAVVLNKVLPDYFRDMSAIRVAQALNDRAPEIARTLAGNKPGETANAPGQAAAAPAGSAAPGQAAAPADIGAPAGSAAPGHTAAAPGDSATPGDAVETARVLREIADSFLNFSVVARREEEQRTELSTAPEVLAAVPFFDEDIFDMGGLLRLGARIWN
jgi:anion-transporting  ArsA/GET3 family ATPase